MDKEKFINFIQNPGEITMDPDSELCEEVVKAYPYFQSAHLLSILASHQTNSIFYDKTIKKRAIYAADREMLLQLVNHPYQQTTKQGANQNSQQDEWQELQQLIESSTSPVSNEQLLQEIAENSHPSEFKNTKDKDSENDELSASENQISTAESANKTGSIEKGAEDADGHEEKNEAKAEEEKASTEKAEDKAEAKKEVQSQERSFTEWLKHLKKPVNPVESKKEEEPGESKNENAGVSNSENHNTRTKRQSDQEIMDHFLKNDPKLHRQKAEFYDPNEKAQKSITEGEDLVSETLAQIHYDQGFYKKAIDIYERLSLLYPDKFDYFAEKIEAIKAHRNNYK